MHLGIRLLVEPLKNYVRCLHIHFVWFSVLGFLTLLLLWLLLIVWLLLLDIVSLTMENGCACSIETAFNLYRTHGKLECILFFHGKKVREDREVTNHTDKRAFSLSLSHTQYEKAQAQTPTHPFNQSAHK